MKKCGKCGQVKNTKYFGKTKYTNDKYTWMCRDCSREYHRKYSLNRDYSYKKNYPSKGSIIKEHHTPRLKLYALIRKGEIKKEPCFICFNPKSQAHHFDYNLPFAVI